MNSYTLMKAALWMDGSDAKRNAFPLKQISDADLCVLKNIHAIIQNKSSVAG